MKRFFPIMTLGASIVLASTAYAQVNNPSKDDILNQLGNSISQGGAATSSSGPGGAGANLLDSYRNQLNQGMPCVNGNTQGCANLPSGSSNMGSSGGSGLGGGSVGGGSNNGGGSGGSGSGSGSGTGGSSGGGSSSGGSGGSNNGGGNSSGGSGVGSGSGGSSGGGSVGSGTGGSGNGVGTIGGSSGSGNNIGRIAAAVQSALGKRISSLGSNPDPDKVRATVRYVRAMTKILQIYSTPDGKQKITDIINQIGSVSNDQLRQSVANMLKDQNELAVLQVVQRDTGAKALSAAIDDVKNGGGKLSAAIDRVKLQLQSRYGSATGAQREKMKKVLGMLSAHQKNQLPQKVLQATLNPFTVDGDMSMVSGEAITGLLAQTDDYEPIEPIVDNDIIRKRRNQ